MKAAIYHSPRNLKVAELTELSPGNGMVSVRIEYCGICGSDLHAYLHGPEHTVMQRGVMGHEFGGVVEEAGKGVTRFKPGDRVTAIGIGGGFSERWAFPQDMVFPLPEGMSTREAALVEPLAVAMRGVDRSGATESDRIAVIGAGPIGLLTIAVLKNRGFDRVIASEPDPKRREMALKMGAAEALEPGDFSARVKDLTGFDGLSIAFECVGLKATMDTAMNLLGRGERLVVLGALTEPYPLTIFNFFVKEITIIPSFGYVNEFGEAIEVIARREVDPMPIVTGEVPLKAIRDEGFEKLAAGESGLIKVLVKP